VRLYEDAGQVRISVADDGHGISQDELPHVFEPFWTTRGSIAGHTARSGGTGGTLGLGLAVARSLAMAAGGSLDIERTSPRGTIMVACLPTQGAANPGPRPAKPAT